MLPTPAGEPRDIQSRGENSFHPRVGHAELGDMIAIRYTHKASPLAIRIHPNHKADPPFFTRRKKD